LKINAGRLRRVGERKETINLFYLSMDLIIFPISLPSDPSREIDGEKGGGGVGSNTLHNPATELGPKGPSSTSTSSKLSRGPFAKSKSKDIASKSSGLSSTQDVIGESKL